MLHLPTNSGLGRELACSKDPRFPSFRLLSSLLKYTKNHYETLQESFFNKMANSLLAQFDFCLFLSFISIFLWNIINNKIYLEINFILRGKKTQHILKSTHCNET